MATTLQAGSIVVNIVGNDNSLQTVINQASASLRNFGGMVENSITPGFQGFWASFRDGAVTLASLDMLIRNWVITPIRAALGEFARFGDKFAKMSQRTGMSAHDLSLLGFAAEQCGSGIEELGNGMRVFQRQMAEAGRGNKTAIQYFERLGINFNRLQKLSKVDQFKAVSEAIRRIGNETLQADAAMRLFGRGGTALLPLMQEGSGGIDALMREGATLGAGISDEDAKRAAAMTDAMNRLHVSFRGLKNTFIAALADDLIRLVDTTKTWCIWAKELIDRNKIIVQTFTRVVKWTTIALAAFWGWRGVARIFTPLLSSLRPVLGMFMRLGPMLLSLATPWGLIRLAVLGAVGAFAHFSGAGSTLLDWIGKFCGSIKEKFFSAFGGIVNLIQEGRVEDAIQLMWLKIQLFFEEGKLRIVNAFNQMVAAVTEPFLAIYNAISSALAPLWQWVSGTAATVAKYIYSVWDQSMGWLGEMLGTWWGYIRDGWEALQNDLGAVIVGGWWSIATGINNAVAWVRQKWNDALTFIQQAWLTGSKWIARQVGWLIAKISGLDVNEVMDDIERQYNLQFNALDERSQAKSDGIEASRQGWQDYLDDMALKSLDRVDQAKASAPKSNERIDRLKLEIERLEIPTKKDPKTEAFQQRANEVITGTYNAGNKITTKSSGTFSAFEIGSLADDRIDKDQLVELKEIRRGIDNLKPTPPAKWKA